jgi:hypothetical protein
MSFKNYYGPAGRRSRKLSGPVDLIALIAKAEEYDNHYLGVITHSVELYSDRSDEIIEEFLSRKNRGAFHLTNPHSKRIWLAEVLNEFLSEHRQRVGSKWREAEHEQVAFAFVTLIHRDWICSENNIKFDLVKAKQKVRNALAGTNYIANFDVALYTNEDWITEGILGKCISFHCHAVVWMRNRTQLDRLRKRIRPRFEPILGKSNGAHFKEVKTVDDAAYVLAYSRKMPFFGYRSQVDKNGKKTQVKTPKVTFKSRWHLFNELKKHSLFDFSLSGGAGTGILRAARNRCKAKHGSKEPGTHATRGTRRPITAARKYLQEHHLERKIADQR